MHSCILFVLLVSLFRPSLAISDENDCAWRENLTSTYNLPHHKYAVLENCLIYYLQNKTETDTGITDAFNELPPVTNPNDKIKFEITEIGLHNTDLSMWSQTLNFYGWMKVTWTDPRISWTPGLGSGRNWPKDSIDIKDSGDIWVPDFEGETYQQSTWYSSSSVDYYDIKAKPTGQVTARLEFGFETHCSIDYFKSGSETCCSRFESKLYRQFMDYSVSAQTVKLDKLKNIDTVLFGATFDKKTLDDGSQVLNLCGKVSMNSPGRSLQLGLPMTISAIVVILAPLYGPLLYQVIGKLFALQLQYQCFSNLNNGNVQWFILYGTHYTPKIYVFYAFSVTLTMVSLMATAAALFASRSQRQSSPPDALLTLANLLSRPDADSDPTTAATPTAQWQRAINALHNAFSIIVTAIYILAFIVFSI